MDFARRQLEKYGWTDGKGLGKHENGIAQALKPKLKRSVTGVGHNAASEFNDHWWETLYDKAATNIQVEEKNGNTKKIKRKDESGFEITNSMWHLKKKKKVKDEKEYQDYFIRKAVLTSGGVKIEKVAETDSEEESAVKRDVSKLTDEELFAACEGRTAHKGARHGLKALGKLARIEEQEKLLLQQPKYDGYSHTKIKKKQVKIETNESCKIETENNIIDEYAVVTKKKKRKKQEIEYKDSNTRIKVSKINKRNIDNEIVIELNDSKKCKSNTIIGKKCNSDEEKTIEIYQSKKSGNDKEGNRKSEKSNCNSSLDKMNMKEKKKKLNKHIFLST